MSLPSGAAGITVNPGPAKSAETRLYGRRRILLRAGVGAVALLSLGLLLVRLPAFVTQVQTVCAGSPCAYGQLTNAAVEALQTWGLSLGDYAAFQIAVALLWTVLNLVVAALIVWRKSDDWMALLVASLMVLWPTAEVIGAFTFDAYATVQAHQFPAPLMNLLTRFGFFLVFALFPNGRLVSRWTLVPLGTFFAIEFSYHFLYSWPLAGLVWPVQIAKDLDLAALLSLVPIQWYRYRYLASAVERQQIKWAALGISAVVGGFVLRLAPTLLIPIPREAGTLYNALTTTALICVALLIPLSIGLAILRYRLWDVDVLIRKTLVYGLLTGTLVAVYTGLIIGLESLVGRLTAQSAQPLVIVISTLAIAALFQPLRARIQRLIDRRFYRKKYDAARTLAAFSAALRDEVDLTQLAERLTTVVEETMQPSHVSLWLRPASQARKPNTPT